MLAERISKFGTFYGNDTPLMIEAVIGVAANDGTHPVPLAAARRGSPNRLDFFRIVSDKFRQYDINPEAPWT